MTVTSLALIAIDLVAAAILVFALFYPRHRRRDLVVAFLGVNVGVLAVTTVLGSADVAMGLGLGLFGVLSIIRLRSSEINQREVAYYFSALAIGLISGLPHTSLLLPVALVALILAVMLVADHPRLLSGAGSELVRLDRAIVESAELRAEVEGRLGVTVTGMSVQEVNFVNETTLVDVRFNTRQSVARTEPVAQLRTVA